MNNGNLTLTKNNDMSKKLKKRTDISLEHNILCSSISSLLKLTRPVLKSTRVPIWILLDTFGDYQILILCVQDVTVVYVSPGRYSSLNL